jgi:hypothetical protein
MFSDPVQMIDQTLDNLETLAALFADEIDERTHGAVVQSPTLHRCREAHRAITALMPKLKAARATQQLEPISNMRHPPICWDCD